MTSGRVVERDAQGRAVRMTGTVVDIDRRKKAEHSMRDAEARYRTLVDLSPDAVLLNSHHRIEYANRAAAEMFGVSAPALLVGREVLEMVHPEDRAMIAGRVEYLRSGPGKTKFNELRMLREDGSVAWLEGASVSYFEHDRLVIQTVLRPAPERTRARDAAGGQRTPFEVVEGTGRRDGTTRGGRRSGDPG
jgi:PAS domain S-box-containing protein